MPGTATQSASQLLNSQQVKTSGASSLGATQMRRSNSTGILQKSGQSTMRPRGKQAVPEEEPEPPEYLAVHALTKAPRRLAQSTGNLHGFMAEDYHKLNWPLPEMFGEEKYAYSLVNISDPTFVGEKTDTKKFAPGQTIQPAQWKRGQVKENLHNRHELADMSKQLIRLHYDQQIMDLEWRKTYKVLLDAEHKQTTFRPREGLPAKMKTKTEEMLKKDVDIATKNLLELQEQKDLFAREIQDVYDRCATIKAQLRQQHFLEDMRNKQEAKTREQFSDDNPFWGNKFNITTNQKKKDGPFRALGS